MTALSIVQTAAAWLALPIPQTLFSATDAQTVELRSLLNEEQTELCKWGSKVWTKLNRQWTFTTTATDVQPANAVPPDLDYIMMNTMWDRTTTRPVQGPIDPATYQAWRARPVLTSVVFGYRIRGNDFLTAPNPPAGDLVYYEYVSKYGVYASGDTAPTQQYFEADTDTSFLDETMMSRGVRWRFLSQKGLPYQQQYQEWIELVQREVARDGGVPLLNAAGNYLGVLPGPYVPQFNWPG